MSWITDPNAWVGLLTLTALGRFPLWAAIIVVGREASIAALRAYLGTRGRSMPASNSAKVKTTAQLLAITLYILPLPGRWDGVKLAVLTGAIVLTVYTGLEYVVAAAKIRTRRPVDSPKIGAR